MTDLGIQLDRLGLSQYLDALVAEGFDTWETVLDITESDLNYLNFKLGHRRKLQRAIAESRGQPPDKALLTEAHKAGVNLDPSDDSGTERKETRASSQSAAGASGQKRKYRRHPKNDPNAPERPPSAYVIFSNQVREEMKGQDLGFTEIAKVNGERWQALSPEVKETYEQTANAAKERYNAAMNEYKKTAEYAQYQEYLADFKAKHGPGRIEGKRSRLETETSDSLLATLSSHESFDNSQSSKSAPTLSAARSSRSSPPSAGIGPSSGYYSDAVHSPTQGDAYSASHRSPMSTASMTTEPRLAAHGQSTPLPRAQTNLPPPELRAYETWPGSGSGTGTGQPGIQISASRRGPSAGLSTPPLVRNESTISSAGSVVSLPLPLGIVGPKDSKMPMRMLPQPIMGASGSVARGLPADLRATMTAPSFPRPAPLEVPEGQGATGSKLPALLRAIEIAREQAAMDTSEHEEDIS